MARLLTEQEVRNIGYKGSATTNLLCTFARAQAMGCVANGTSLASNQLVWEGSVKRDPYPCEGCMSTTYIDYSWAPCYRWKNNCSYSINIVCSGNGSTKYETLASGQATEHITSWSCSCR